MSIVIKRQLVQYYRWYYDTMILRLTNGLVLMTCHVVVRTMLSVRCCMAGVRSLIGRPAAPTPLQPLAHLKQGRASVGLVRG